ncbi:hypothetical protein V5799_033808, partial [Amblyomma americanum]
SNTYGEVLQSLLYIIRLMRSGQVQLGLLVLYSQRNDICLQRCFHNIENSTKNDDSRWIVFWVIFGLFGVMDHFNDQIREHFPLFWLFKLLFLTWCLAPTNTNGVTTIYFHLLYPLFLGVNDPCTTVPNFGDGQELCNRIWQRCYPWAP